MTSKTGLKTIGKAVCEISLKKRKERITPTTDQNKLRLKNLDQTANMKAKSACLNTNVVASQRIPRNHHQRDKVEIYNRDRTEADLSANSL
ncbi:hypothetical protein [Halobellus sp. GM3]|uniref:hypothetical protein n=1 Tax=Halobellus sp. GM3 TaxID=3458410 RepID=UPI00403DFF8D